MIQKIGSNKAHGVLVAPHWPAQPWFADLKQIVANIHISPNSRPPVSLPAIRQSVHEPALEGRNSRSLTRSALATGMRVAVLRLTGHNFATGGGEEAETLLANFIWSDNTFLSRNSQLKKWAQFCDEDMRSIIMATEGDILAYIGYLSMEGRISDTSLPQYISAVRRFHILHGVPSPTNSPLVKYMMTAYTRGYQAHVKTRLQRIGCSATDMRSVLQLGMKKDDSRDVFACAS